MALERDIPEDMGVGIERGWLHDGRLLVITISESSQETTDKTVQILSEAMGQWPIERPYLLLLDTSRAILTPYAKGKMTELGNLQPELKGRVAVIVAPSALGHMISLFVNRMMPKHTRERRVFFSRDVAIQWLEELL